ncbi:hypothetical protein [Kitasatospora sp. NBC_01300]|uniref:hypothetical protein n=1 Tax=Kitasatospora sp. NBC_01300 TaxID=2903574 RepID=UPI002F90D2C7|nr:hypothetical protein OG556_38365 [Kitasatospora sp. NBC_01300]
MPSTPRPARALRRVCVLAATTVAAGLLTVSPASADGTYYPDGNKTPTSTGTLGTGVGNKLTGAQMVQRARDWVAHGVTYNQGQSFSDSAVGGPYRTDCGGLVDMAWQLPGSPPVTYPAPGIDDPKYSTKLSSWSQLQPGDALAVAGKHINLFAGWTNQAAGDFTYIAEDNSSVPTKEYSANTHWSSIDGYPTSSFELLRSKNLAPAIPADFNVLLWGFNSGQTVSGTLNLTAHPTQSGVINWLDYVVTGPNGYYNRFRATSGGATNYQVPFDTAPLAAGTFSISMIANEIDGQEHTYQGGVFTIAPQASTARGSADSTVLTSNGTIALYRVGADGNVYGTNQNTPGGPFVPWAQLSTGGGFVGKPAALQTPSGLMVVYARTTGGTIQGTNQSTPGGPFGSWVTVADAGDPTGVASDPSVVFTQSGTIAVYVTSANGNVVGASQGTPGGPFSPWQQLSSGGGFVGKPAALQVPNGTMVVYARTTAGTIQGSNQSTPGGPFGSWVTVADAGDPTGVASDPSAVFTQSGTIAVYVTSANGNVVGASQGTPGGPFSPWQQLSSGGGFVGKPAALQVPNGTMVVYARTTAGTIQGSNQSTPGGPFGSWVTVADAGDPTGVASDPSVVFSQFNTIAIYVTSANGNIAGSSQATPGGPFSPWGQIG